MKSSEVYKDAFSIAQEHAGVQAAIGTPVGDGIFSTGKINTNGPSGHAQLAIPIHGPKGKATIYAVAEKSVGKWHFLTLVVEIKDTRQRIDLLE